MDTITALPELERLTLQRLLERQRRAFTADPMPSLAQRREALLRLKRALIAQRHALATAVDQDFGGRAAQETLFADIMPVVQGIDHTLAHLRRWMRPSRRRVGINLWPGKAEVRYQPLGVVGIIVPWNYPIQLALAPLVGALAAGNRVMLKLSELVPATNAVLRDLLGSAFAVEEVAVVEGGREVGEAFARLPFDHLLFTGSTAVGRQIMRAAAENLTPVTLELGGKSPAIIHESYPLEAAAQKICFGKTLNAGQTCVAPDYVLCPESRVEAFVAAFRNQYIHMYPRLLGNPDYTAIVSDGHRQRLRQLLEDAERKGARIITLDRPGEDLSGSRKMPVSLVLNTNDDMRVRQEEIFGPILPIIPYRGLDEALAFVAARPRPLALYYFDHDRERQDYVLDHSHAGGVSINDTLLHLAVDDMPFGGIGPSGMGHYHGWEGFQTFSKAKSVFRQSRYSLIGMAYPPYKPWITRMMERWLLR